MLQTQCKRAVARPPCHGHVVKLCDLVNMASYHGGVRPWWERESHGALFQCCGVRLAVMKGSTGRVQSYCRSTACADMLAGPRCPMQYPEVSVQGRLILSTAQFPREYLFSSRLGSQLSFDLALCRDEDA